MPNGETPPSGVDRLGTKIQNFLEGTPPFSWMLSADDVVRDRGEELAHWFEVDGIPRMQGRHLDWYHRSLLALLYVPFGIDAVGIKAPESPGESVFANPSQTIGNAMRSAFDNPVVGELSQMFGAVFVDPVLATLEAGITESPDEPLAGARAFYSVMTGVGAASGLASAAIEAATAGQVENGGKILENMYWNFGLGFLGWQTLAPLLENGLQPPLRRHYNEKFRPERFSSSQMSDLFALGEVSADEVRSELRAVGWRDQDIEQWIKLSYRALSEGDVWKLYHDGAIDKAQVDQRLRALGFNPDDLDLLHKANETGDTEEFKDVLLSTAKNAYTNDLLSRDDFERILRDQKRTDEEITLQVALLDMQKAESAASFSRSEIRQLYASRTIAKPEAVAYLIKTDLEPEQAELLLSGWEAADAPEPLRINQATIREAFTDGVLSRAAAKERLVTVGYLTDEAELLIRTWETEVAPAEPVPGPRGAGALSLSVLSQFGAAGLIGESAMAARPEFEIYSTEDRAKLITLIFSAPTIGATELSESVLVEAYRFAILSRDDLRERLAERGLSESDVTLALEVIDAQIGEGREGEITGTVKRPSVGSLQLALQRGLIEEGYFKSQLLELGFNADAVQIYLFNAQYQAPARPRDLPRATVMALYRDQDIGRADTQYRLVKLGYTVNDAQLLIKNERLAPVDTEVGEAYLAGLMFAVDARVWFEEFGFTVEVIDNFFAEFPPGAA